MSYMGSRQLIYLPVSVTKDREALIKSRGCFNNALKRCPESAAVVIRGKEAVGCDSGDLQILTQGFDKGKQNLDRGLVRNEETCKKGRNRKEGGSVKPQTAGEDPDRHQLLGVGERKARPCQGL